MDAYIVIGDQHSYKSSVIRSLSGNRISGVRPYVILPRTMTKVYVRLSSLQEGKGIQPADFETLVSASGAAAVLFALRPHRIGAFPDADVYLTHFVKVGWTIQRVAVMNSTTSPLSIALPADRLSFFSLGSPPVAVNQIAANVRTYFNWM